MCLSLVHVGPVRKAHVTPPYSSTARKPWVKRRNMQRPVTSSISVSTLQDCYKFCLSDTLCIAIEPWDSDTCSYITIECAKITITAQRTFFGRQYAKSSCLSNSFHTYWSCTSCNGGTGSLVLPLEAQRGKKLTKTRIAPRSKYPRLTLGINLRTCTYFGMDVHKRTKLFRNTNACLNIKGQ
jgi:hypothetical protein